MGNEKNSIGNKKVSVWNISEEYLKSLWKRIDDFDKGLERAVNVDYLKARKTYKECRELLENVLRSLKPYMKDYNTVLKKITDVETELNKKPIDHDSEKINAYWTTIKKNVTYMKEVKEEIIMKLAEMDSLLPRKIKYDTLTNVFRDDV